MNKFNVGDTVFVPISARQQKQIPCPICFGKLNVALILGNDDKIILPCGYCGHGWNEPTGHIMEYMCIVDAECKIITSVRINKTESGEQIEYAAGHYVYKETEVFADKDNALQAAKNIKARQDEEERTRAEFLKHKAKKSFAWNAGYHMREAKRNRWQAEYHETKAVLCKVKAKE